jgi:hypothetical protein
LENVFDGPEEDCCTCGRAFSGSVGALCLTTVVLRVLDEA